MRRLALVVLLAGCLGAPSPSGPGEEPGLGDADAGGGGEVLWEAAPEGPGALTLEAQAHGRCRLRSAHAFAAAQDGLNGLLALETPGSPASWSTYTLGSPATWHAGPVDLRGPRGVGAASEMDVAFDVPQPGPIRLTLASTGWEPMAYTSGDASGTGAFVRLRCETLEDVRVAWSETLAMMALGEGHDGAGSRAEAFGVAAADRLALATTGPATALAASPGAAAARVMLESPEGTQQWDWATEDAWLRVDGGPGEWAWEATGLGHGAWFALLAQGEPAPHTIST